VTPHRLHGHRHSVRTNLKGRAAFGVKPVRGRRIHAEELGAPRYPDAPISGIFAAAGVAPKASSHRLRW